ncbi:MAG: type I-E CRISPR-associated protein Cas5/CasD [Hyphomicrobiales bacterium]|nr:type I-E CRISPR-associated protein Cas5/CasD [Hyphomicrobiales bacterium]MCA1998514.1 type I-E CRISPR-associated protein Cas5/CasD [Hyphomicrobiales bacterium]
MTEPRQPEHRWLILSLEGPLLAFGGVTIDHVGVTRDFPAASMLTGLFANALGYRRSDWMAHQSLQDRLIFAARREREPMVGILTDSQNAKLEKNDRGWTTWGVAEERAGASYDAPHRRKRDYHMDASVTVVLRLAPPEKPDDRTSPDLDALAHALDHPHRPLFIGRKPCLPAGRVVGIRHNDSSLDFVTAPSAYEALRRVPAASEQRAIWPRGEGPEAGRMADRIVDLPDLRNWRTGLHGGVRQIVEGRIETGSEAA